LATKKYIPKKFFSENVFVLFAIAANMVNLCMYALLGAYTGAIAEFIGVVFLIGCILLNNKGQFNYSRVLSLGIVNFQLSFLAYCYGVGSGATLYLFPYILSLLFVLKFKERRDWVALAFTFLCLIVTLSISNFSSGVFKLETNKLSILFYANLVITFLLTVAFFVFALYLLKLKERKILRAKRFRDNVFNTSLDAVVIINLEEQTLEDCNAEAISMFNFKLDEKKRKVISDWTFLREILFEKVPILKEETVNNFWQGDIKFDVLGFTFYTYTNAVIFYYEKTRYCKLSFLDVTHQRKSTEEMLQAKLTAENALHVRSRFLSNMSHELRTPLNGIIGAANILRDTDASFAKNEFFEIIDHSSQHMLALVNQVLDYSKLETEDFSLLQKPFHIRRVIHDLIQSFKFTATSKDISLQHKIAENVPAMVVGDELRLTQILINLVGNAIKFSTNGVIEVNVSTVYSNNKSLQIYFEVKDNGIGISAEKYESIFESFVQADAETTRKYGGTGLGLAISKQLVQKMGGDLLVKPNQPKGTVFYFEISFTSFEGVAEEATSAGSSILPLNNKSILLVEDNPVNMIVAKTIIKKWGANVVTAKNGVEGLKAFEEGLFDILLIDLEMPEMDGREMIKRVRNKNATIPTVAFTAAAYDNIFDDVKKLGFNAFMPKPFEPQHLNTVISELL
jgi:signal transduction histidine kinase/CheY-like chemotaxis protein